MSSRTRVTSSHRGNRRSHHKVVSPRLSTCEECGAKHLRHTMCEECGNYRGRKVIDMEAVKQKKLERELRKKRTRGEETEE